MPPRPLGPDVVEVEAPMQRRPRAHDRLKVHHYDEGMHAAAPRPGDTRMDSRRCRVGREMEGPSQLLLLLEVAPPPSCCGCHHRGWDLRSYSFDLPNDVLCVVLLLLKNVVAKKCVVFYCVPGIQVSTQAGLCVVSTASRWAGAGPRAIHNIIDTQHRHISSGWAS